MREIMSRTEWGLRKMCSALVSLGRRRVAWTAYIQALDRSTFPVLCPRCTRVTADNYLILTFQRILNKSIENVPQEPYAMDFSFLTP